MRTLMTPLALIAALGTAGAAGADTTSGTIADVSAITGDLTLENGMEFRFSEANAGKLDNFKAGDTVSVDWIAVGDRKEGRQISPTGGAATALTGIVTAASAVTGQVSLANGVTLDFEDGTASGLDNFGPGDTVAIQYVTVGDALRGLSIKPAGVPANIAEGAIQELNENGRVALADGSEYDFNGMDDEMLDNFSVGDRVAIHYLTQGDAKVALAISPLS